MKTSRSAARRIGTVEEDISTTRPIVIRRVRAARCNFNHHLSLVSPLSSFDRIIIVGGQLCQQLCKLPQQKSVTVCQLLSTLSHHLLSILFVLLGCHFTQLICFAFSPEASLVAVLLEGRPPEIHEQFLLFGIKIGSYPFSEAPLKGFRNISLVELKSTSKQPSHNL